LNLQSFPAFFMKKRIQYFIASIFGVLILAVPAFAQFGLQETAGAAGLAKYGGSVPVLVGNVIGAALSMVSVIFFALMIYGGIRYMIARGNEEDTKKAINTIWAAVIGILIVLASYAITTFVFSSLGAQEPVPPTGTGPEDNFTCDTTSVTECANQPEGTACTINSTPGTCIKTGTTNACSCDPN
jgi:heme/copper-type cytochrome/quinol oxidase subunit 2